MPNPNFYTFKEIRPLSKFHSLVKVRIFEPFFIQIFQQYVHIFLQNLDKKIFKNPRLFQPKRIRKRSTLSRVSQVFTNHCNIDR